MPTLHERFDAAQVQSFFPRIRAALAVVASQVVAEDPETPNHTNRLGYARDVYRNPDAHIAYWMFGVTGGSTFGTGTDDPAEDSAEGDTALIDCMTALWDGYAGTGEPPPSPPEADIF